MATVATPVAPDPKPKRRGLIIGGAALAALLIAGGAFFGLRNRGASGGAAGGGAATGGFDPHRIAVLYFKPADNGDSLLAVADGLTEDLIRELRQIQGLDVVSKGGVEPYRGDSLPVDSIAKVLRAGTIVSGDVSQRGGKLRVSLRLVDGASGADFERTSFEQPTGSLLAVQDTLAQQAARLIRARLGEEIRVREQRQGTKSIDAWLLVQQAARHRKTAEAAASKADTAAYRNEFQAADSLLALAEPLDPSWNEPVLARGWVAYRQSRLAASDPAQANSFIHRGMSFADTVLGRDNADPDALELRGTLEYWKWLLRLEQDPAAAKALFASARKDLEAATRINPAQAGAWGSLSHLYGLADGAGETDIVLAARRAYESDAYLENAPKIIERLFNGYYDLDQAVDASHWCDEGFRRFPDNGIFTTCQLYLMTMRGQTPDPTKAWRLANSDAIAKDPSAGSPELIKRDALLMVAAVLARAGLTDSARAVARGGPAGTDVDPSRFLYLQQAFALLLAGDKPGAVGALKVYLAANPGRRELFALDPGWRFRELTGDPAFRSLVGAP
jgi:serine/threonine-protein kinase